MSEDILVNVTPRETRVAVVENGVLQEVYIERAQRRGIVGNLYKGRVSRALPGMQAAFVDIGLARTAFLHASDIHVAGTPDFDPMPVEGARPPTRRSEANITDLVREGQDILVQVVKDPLGTKGARLTTHITIPSRYLVYMPDNVTVGVSQRIEDENERLRLKEMAQQLAIGRPGGYILRTAAEGVTAEALSADMDFLNRLWEAIQERVPLTPAGAVVHEDLPLAVRILRDLSSTHVEKIRIDSRESYRRVMEFAERFVPEIVARIEYYPGERPIFDLYSVEDEIAKALDRKVQLKSGGYLIIDQTEAMTTVDVNTGAFVGHRNLEETIFKTNLEATHAIARQLRLRNLGGIIIIDFIDMAEEEHKTQVLRALEKALERDHAKNYISGVSALGLVEMTRKRTRESLERVLCEPCPTCSGRGSLKTPETVCYEIFREILREARQYDARQFLVLAAPEVVELMLDEESTSIADLEEFIGRTVKFQVEGRYNQEQYEVVLL